MLSLIYIREKHKSSVRNKSRGSYTNWNTHWNMVAQNVSFISTDVNRKHDSYTIVINIDL